MITSCCTEFNTASVNPCGQIWHLSQVNLSFVTSEPVSCSSFDLMDDGRFIISSVFTRSYSGDKMEELWQVRYYLTSYLSS